LDDRKDEFGPEGFQSRMSCNNKVLLKYEKPRIKQGNWGFLQGPNFGRVWFEGQNGQKPDIKSLCKARLRTAQELGDLYKRSGRNM